MRDGRPNPDIWGNIITCGEIAVGIYEIVGTKKRGLEVAKALAEEILPESVMEQAAQDGENLCFTDHVSNEARESVERILDKIEDIIPELREQEMEFDFDMEFGQQEEMEIGG